MQMVAITGEYRVRGPELFREKTKFTKIFYDIALAGNIRCTNDMSYKSSLIIFLFSGVPIILLPCIGVFILHCLGKIKRDMLGKFVRAAVVLLFFSAHSGLTKVSLLPRLIVLCEILIVL